MMFGGYGGGFDPSGMMMQPMMMQGLLGMFDTLSRREQAEAQQQQFGNFMDTIQNNPEVFQDSQFLISPFGQGPGYGALSFWQPQNSGGFDMLGNLF